MAVGDLQALVVHYKIIHMLRPDSAYTCLENNCCQCQTFNCLSLFKRHFKRKHITFNIISQNSQHNDVLMSNENNVNYDPQTPQSMVEHSDKE